MPEIDMPNYSVEKSGWFVSLLLEIVYILSMLFLNVNWKQRWEWIRWDLKHLARFEKSILVWSDDYNFTFPLSGLPEQPDFSFQNETIFASGNPTGEYRVEGSTIFGWYHS